MSSYGNRYKKKSEPPQREITVRINQESGVKFQKENYAICSCVILKNDAMPDSVGKQLTIKGVAPFQLYPGQTLKVKGVAAKQVSGMYAGKWHFAVKHMRDCADDSTVLKRVVLGVTGVGQKTAENILNTVVRCQEVANRDALGIGGIDAMNGRVVASKEQVNALQTVIDNPRILLASGINNELASRVYASIKSHVTENKALDFLYRLDLTDRVIGLIKNHFNGLSHKVLVERIFELTSVKGVGFITASMIADKLGVPADAPQRLKAAVFYAVSKAISDGSIYATSEELSKLLGDLVPAVEVKKFGDIFKTLFATGQLVESSVKIGSACEGSIIPDDVIKAIDATIV